MWKMNNYIIAICKFYVQKAKIDWLINRKSQFDLQACKIYSSVNAKYLILGRKGRENQILKT